LKVREYTREDARKLRIVFDNPALGLLTAQQYENGVALAASLAWHFAAEDIDLSFAAGGYGGSSDLYDFLHYLALVQPAAGGSVLEEFAVSDSFHLILTARTRGSIPSALAACSYLWFLA
jgi:uncharacterized protein (DUF58 family)